MKLTVNCVFFVFLDMITRSDCHFQLKETERLWDSKSRRERDNEERVSFLYSGWSAVLNETTSGGKEYLQKHGIRGSSLPNAPHLENCKVKTQLYEYLDKRTGTDAFPPWTTWKGSLQTFSVAAFSEQMQKLRHEAASEGAYPPWVCS